MRAMTSKMTLSEGSILSRKSCERGEVIAQLGSENWSSTNSNGLLRLVLAGVSTDRISIYVFSIGDNGIAVPYESILSRLGIIHGS